MITKRPLDQIVDNFLIFLGDLSQYVANTSQYVANTRAVTYIYEAFSFSIEWSSLFREYTVQPVKYKRHWNYKSHRDFITNMCCSGKVKFLYNGLTGNKMYRCGFSREFCCSRKVLISEVLLHIKITGSYQPYLFLLSF